VNTKIKAQNKFNPDFAFHPGETLREKLEELSIGSKEFALRTNKPEKTISQVLNGNSNITPEMAILFETVLDIPASFWLRKQALYDEYLARSARENIVDQSLDWAKCFPYAAMVKLGWIQEAKTINEKTVNLFSFFDMTAGLAWENFYLKKSLNATFRLSLKGAKNPYNLSVWLRQGEIQESQIIACEFNKTDFESMLPFLKAIMVKAPKNYMQQVQGLCLKAGLKIIFTPNIAHAPHGASRWIKSSPIIQLSDKWNRYDIFWFTLFHEIGHILLHPTKLISLEHVEYDEVDLSKEKEANDFAVKWVFNHEEESKFVSSITNFTLPIIKNYAKSVGTHPSIIVGRLWHKHYIQPAHAMKLLKEIGS
jgi:HTH-type transcriptional regulator / antitoxin HigA